jgi:hypothetical protein
VAPASAWRPTAQLRQEVDLVKAWYEPAAQLVQIEAVEPEK